MVVPTKIRHLVALNLLTFSLMWTLASLFMSSSGMTSVSDMNFCYFYVGKPPKVVVKMVSSALTKIASPNQQRLGYA